MEDDNFRDPIGYCDVHPGSKLIRAAVMIGHATGDKNVTEYWRCSLEECDRCYDPVESGYFNLSRQRGSYMQSSAQKQERCGRHEHIVMVVDEIGQERRLRCPHADCDQVGSTI